MSQIEIKIEEFLQILKKYDGNFDERFGRNKKYPFFTFNLRFEEISTMMKNSKFKNYVMENIKNIKVNFDEELEKEKNQFQQKIKKINLNNNKISSDYNSRKIKSKKEEFKDEFSDDNKEKKKNSSSDSENISTKKKKKSGSVESENDKINQSNKQKVTSSNKDYNQKNQIKSKNYSDNSESEENSNTKNENLRENKINNMKTKKERKELSHSSDSENKNIKTLSKKISNKNENIIPILDENNIYKNKNKLEKSNKNKERQSKDSSTDEPKDNRIYSKNKKESFKNKISDSDEPRDSHFLSFIKAKDSSDETEEEEITFRKEILNESMIKEKEETLKYKKEIKLSENALYVLDNEPFFFETLVSELKRNEIKFKLESDEKKLQLSSNKKEKFLETYDLVKNKLDSIKKKEINLEVPQFHGLKKVFHLEYKKKSKIENVWFTSKDGYIKSESDNKVTCSVKIFYFDDLKGQLDLEKVINLFCNYKCRKINFINFKRKKGFFTPNPYLIHEAKMIDKLYFDKIKKEWESFLKSESWYESKCRKIEYKSNKKNREYDGAVIFYYKKHDENDSITQSINTNKYRYFGNIVFIILEFDPDAKYLKKFNDKDQSFEIDFFVQCEENKLKIIGNQEKVINFLEKINNENNQNFKYLMRNNFEIIINKSKFCLESEKQKEIETFFQDNKIKYENNNEEIYLKLKFKNEFKNNEKIAFLLKLIRIKINWRTDSKKFKERKNFQLQKNSEVSLPNDDVNFI